MSATETTIPHSLYATICPNCAYSLLGLPETGICPECGRQIDQSEIVLYGNARGRRANMANVKTSSLIWYIIPVLVWIGITAQNIFVFGRTAYHFPLPVLAIFILQILYQLARRQKSGFPGRMQIRLSERGCVQYDALPEPSPFYELFRTQSWLIPALIALGILLGYQNRGVEKPWVWILCPILLLAAFFLWYECRRIRRIIAKLGDNAIADRNAAFYSTTRWQSTRYFKLIEQKPEVYRLRIEDDGGQFPIDGEINCTSEQAEELRRWLAGRTKAG